LILLRLAWILLRRGLDFVALDLVLVALDFAFVAPVRVSRRTAPANDELDPVVGKFAPGFDLGHVGRLGEALEPSRAFSRASPRGKQKLSRRQASSLAPAFRRLVRRPATRAARSLGFLVSTAITALFGERLARFLSDGEAGLF
jgi:hypothetical protein